MMKTMNKHVIWRKDKREIFICDCKRLIDLKLPLEYEDFMKKLESGLDGERLEGKEKLAFLDFEKMKLLSNLEIRKIREDEFGKLIEILDEELGKERVRNGDFLHKKFEECPDFFIGAFLDNELIGVICGFPREDYLLLSELAVLSRFQKRGFGRMLVKFFEKISEDKYKKINVGADDHALGFYKLLGYRPFLLIQFKKGDYSEEDFKSLNINRVYENNGEMGMEIEIEKISADILDNFRKKYPKGWFQYIFTKKIK